MLEFDDIQYILLTRAPAITGRYEFLSFRNAAAGRAWLAAILETVHSVQQARASIEKDNRWVSVAFTWNGLRALGAAEGSLASFPEEFKQGMVARAEVLGDTGAIIPKTGSAGSPVRTSTPSSSSLPATRRNASGARRSTQRLVAQCDGVEVLSSLDLEATPPFDYAHDHFGYRDRMSQPVIEGSGEEPTPGSGAPLKAGEFILGYPDEDGSARPICRSLRSSPVTAATWPIAVCEEHVGAFRDFLRQNGQTPEEQELVAAKLMGRWRSGAPLVLAPDKDDPALGADPQRNNDFNYKQMDPHGYAVPLGSHMRRMNPRDTAANMNRRRMIRRGGDLRPASAGERPGGRHRARHRRIRDLREPHPPVRVRAERVGERSEFSRARQRARSDHRQPGRHARIQNPEASDPKENHRPSGIHHRPRRRLFFSARPQGAAIPCVTR